MANCSRCGHPFEVEDRFCASCGQPVGPDEATAGLPVVDGEGTPDAYPFPGEELLPGQALMLLTTGPAAGSTVLVDADVLTLGRDPGSDVFLDDVTVSRKHAELRRREDGFYVHDLGSLNGTYVNRERVDITKLASRDEIQIGRYKLVFFLAD